MLKRGRSYSTHYQGNDPAAAEEFHRLSALARELALSYGSLQSTGSTHALSSTHTVPFHQTWLTATSSQQAGSRDIEAITGASAGMRVRYGGVYRVSLWGIGQFLPVVAGSKALVLLVNGSPVSGLLSPYNPFPYAWYASATVPLTFGLAIEFHIELADKDLVQWRISGVSGDTIEFFSGMTFNMRGNRL